MGEIKKVLAMIYLVIFGLTLFGFLLAGLLAGNKLAIGVGVIVAIGLFLLSICEVFDKR
jgi:hypothetical protein